MRAKLTRDVVKRARPETVDGELRALLIWDRELPGFGLKVTPAGRKVFVFQYRLRSVPRRITLGRYGALTVEQARDGWTDKDGVRHDGAKQLAGRVAAGDDPATEKRSARLAANEATVEKLAAQYLELLAARATPVSVYEYRRVFSKYVNPALGSKPVAALTLRDVSALHMAHRTRPIMANRIVTTLRAFLNWCERRGYRPRGSNPCRDVERFQEQSRERFLSPTEVTALGAALNTAERDGLPVPPKLRERAHGMATARRVKLTGRKRRPYNRKAPPRAPERANPYAVAAIRFLMLSGWREQEALTLRWSDVNLERGTATLGATKTGRSQRRLGPPALALLHSLPRLDGSPFVFPGSQPGKPLRELKRVWLAARHAAGLDDVRLHDLRHSFASFAVGSGLSLYLTGQLLGHKQAATTQRYAHFADDVLRAAADEVSSTVWAAMQGQQTAKVLPLRAKRAAR